ncbi:MAG: Na/Pi cotransporter family protein [Pirellulaceae bacterium]
MNPGLLDALGGLGVFLLGMVVMTNGLKSLAGDALRKALARFTNSPLSGAVTGAISTAVIQSSSATTVTAVGFVGAGLITFSQALGIIFGANIGTTITGWFVAILGFKLKIGTLALPLVLLGVLMNLFLRRRWSDLGMVLAGFGLIFVGIGLIQQGMAGLQGIVTPESLPQDTLGGRFLLLLIGVAFTLVTQSSSAGIATALVAVHAGTINFPQAAALVIGMDVGTTATAALATIGGSTDVRRTGFAHVIYNCMTGLGAFLLIAPYTWAWESIAPDWFRQNPEIALVGFHTLFNLLGVIAVLPFTNAFARLMIWLVPEQPARYTQRLDRSLYESPVIALAAVRGTLKELAKVIFSQLHCLLTRGPIADIEENLADADEALNRTRDYLTPIDISSAPQKLYPTQLAAIHTIDHLRRLIDRCRELDRGERAGTDPELAPLGKVLSNTVEQALATLETGNTVPAMPATEGPDAVWQELDAKSEQHRHELIANAASNKQDAYVTIGKLDTLRWIRRVAYHVWRIMHYLQDEATKTQDHTEGLQHSDQVSDDPTGKDR